MEIQHQGASRHSPSLNHSELLTPEQVAKQLALSIKTLATWRSTGRHALPFLRCGGRVRYRQSDVDTWLLSQSHTGAQHAQGGVQ